MFRACVDNGCVCVCVYVCVCACVCVCHTYTHARALYLSRSHTQEMGFARTAQARELAYTHGNNMEAIITALDNLALQEQLKKENSEQKQLLEQQTMLIDCVVCMEMPKNILLLPCTHLCICSACSANLMGQEPQLCPICRQPVKEAKEVKIS